MADIWVQILSPIISLLSLGIVIYDRRVKLRMRVREGKWIVQEPDKIFGVIEVYNSSTRANAISAYRYAVRNSEGKWVDIKSAVRFRSNGYP